VYSVSQPKIRVPALSVSNTDGLALLTLTKLAFVVALGLDDVKPSSTATGVPETSGTID
jgi:hypothetical protein